MEADFRRRLGLKAGQRVCLLNAPKGFGEELTAISPAIELAGCADAEPIDMLVARPERDPAVG